MTYRSDAVTGNKGDGISADEQVVDVLVDQDTCHLTCHRIEVPILLRLDGLRHGGESQRLVVLNEVVV